MLKAGGCRTPPVGVFGEGGSEPHPHQLNFLSRRQSSFNVLQTFLQNLKLVANTVKTKCVLFSRTHNSSSHLQTLHGTESEIVQP